MEFDADALPFRLWLNGICGDVYANAKHGLSWICLSHRRWWRL